MGGKGGGGSKTLAPARARKGAKGSKGARRGKARTASAKPQEPAAATT